MLPRQAESTTIQDCQSKYIWNTGRTRNPAAQPGTGGRAHPPPLRSYRHAARPRAKPPDVSAPTGVNKVIRIAWYPPLATASVPAPIGGESTHLQASPDEAKAK